MPARYASSGYIEKHGKPDSADELNNHLIVASTIQWADIALQHGCGRSLPERQLWHAITASLDWFMP